MCSDFLDVDLVNFGYFRYEFLKLLLLVIVLVDVFFVLDEIMKLIKCSCEGLSLCRI